MADAFKDYRTIAALPIVNEKEMHGGLTLYSSELVEYDQNRQKLLTEVTAVLADALAGLAGNPLPDQALTEAAGEASTPTAIEGTNLLQSELTH